MTNCIVTNQQEFDNEVFGLEILSDITLDGETFSLSQHMFVRKLVGSLPNQQTKLYLDGLPARDGLQKYLWFSHMQVENVTLTAKEKIILSIDGLCDLSKLVIDEEMVKLECRKSHQ